MNQNRKTSCLPQSCGTSMIEAVRRRIFWLLLLGIGLSGSGLKAQSNCTLVCNDPDPASPLQVAVNENCETILVPDALLEAPQSCPGPKNLAVFSAGLPVISGVDLVSFNSSPYIGSTLSVVVTDINTGISCTSHIMIVDNLPPTLTCQDQTISCVGDTSVAVTGLPVINENCDNDVTLSYTDNFVTGDCLSGEAAVLTRSWVATDGYGNTATCVQTITLERPDLAEVVFPANVTLDCEDPDVSIAANGSPTLDGVVLMNGGICDVTVTSQDETAFFCGTIEYNVVRTWTVIDNCTGVEVSAVQLIQVRDETPPVITCPDDLMVNTLAGQCYALVNLPAPARSDNCDPSPDFIVSTSYGANNLGPHPFVPTGTHTITYTAIDQCGNNSSCTTTLSITDEEAPTAVCNDLLTVSLPSSGVAVVYAESFDEGSTDNCTDMIYFKVRRETLGACNDLNGDDSDFSGYQEWFDDEVYFCCEELDDDNIMVILRAYEIDPGDGPVDPIRELPGGDLFGHFTQCMVSVDVEDELGPVIACPANMTIGCLDDYSDLSVFGTAFASDNCGVTLDSTEVVDLADCGEGTITRTWTATDLRGHTASCVQTIAIVNNVPFTDSLIVWPEDYTTYTCGASVDPLDLPAGAQEPVILDEGCGMIAYNYSDQVFNTSPPACYKILRKWAVLDWCQYDPDLPNSDGRFTHTQIIKVLDNQAPVITCPADVTVAVGDDCETGTVTLPDVTGQDCSPNLTFTHNSPYAIASGANASGDYPLGTTIITFNASDHCGNAANCQVSITVEDQTPPGVGCIVGLSVNLVDMDGGATASVEATSFEALSSDNCTPDADLLRTVRLANPAGSTMAPTTTSLNFTCGDVGTHLVEFWVTDAAGNADHCVTFVTVQDNGAICPASATTGMVAGIIETEEGEYVESVQVKASNDDPVAVLTGDNGHFMFPQLPLGENYTLLPSRTDGLLNGVSTLDLILISRHILGSEPLDSPFKIIAADVDRSGSVSTFDIIKLRKIILGIDNEFPNGNKSWRFVDGSFVFPDPSNPFVGYFPETYNINNLNGDEMHADFIAIKVGDVNLSAHPNSLLGTEDRITYGAWPIEVTDRAFVADETITVDFTAAQLTVMAGFQFTLMFDRDQLELVELLPGDLPGLTTENFGQNAVGDGYLTASWHRGGEAGLPEQAVLFRLTFRAKTDGTLSEWLQVSSARTAAEAYDQDLLPLEVTLEFPESEADQSFELYQNRPNPFDNQTVIGFKLPRAGAARLTVFDMAGQAIHSHAGHYDAGYNEMIINGSDLPVGGVLYYTLEAADYRETRKMVLLKKN